MALATYADPVRLLLTGGVTPGRALLGDDPALGFLAPAGLPVLLLEPVETFMALDPTGRDCELQTEVLVQQGFQRFEPGADPVGELSGWTVRQAVGQLQLRDGAGELWAYSYVRPGRRWLDAAADAHGRALVVYGTMIGVRAPRGVRAGQYAPAHRAAELQTARGRGLVAAAILTWRG